MSASLETAEASTPKKKVHVETWGCQMNVADSERMLAMLSENNYELTDSADDADLVLLNTCHIREKARHKVVSRLGRLKEIKTKKNPTMKIAVSGCVAQAEGRKLLKTAPQIDILFGPGKIDELPRLLREHDESGQSTVAIGFKSKGNHASPSKKEAAEVTLSGKNEVSRYVNIQQGCNNYCTFCVVPFTRGREISRQPADIITECEAMLDSGASEITLLGQNVNSYGLDLVEKDLLPTTEGGPFVDLLASVAALPRLKRLRFTTSNPHDFSKPLAELFALPQMGRYIHLPVQSGNNDVLTRMKRKVTVAEYYERIDWLRSVHPDMAISTDLIVGFPGETEEQFEDTLALVERCQFSFIFSFKYSPRANTVAARFQDQIPEDVKDRRLARLNALQDEITIAQQQAEIGKQRDVLFLYESKKDPGIYYGRTEHFRLVRVASSRDLVGALVPVTITDGNKVALVGELS